MALKAQRLSMSGQPAVAEAPPSLPARPTPETDTLPKGEDDLPLEKPQQAPPPSAPVAEADLQTLLTAALEQAFPAAPAPTRFQVSELRRLAGATPTPQIVEDILTVLPRIVAKRPPNYLGHIQGVLNSMLKPGYGYESFHNEAVAIRRSGKVDPNVQREQTNNRLAVETPPPPPAVSFDILLAMRRDQLLSGE